MVLGTLLSIGLTILCAYAMAQPDERFHARKYYVWVFLVTMVFSGGLIPLFIVVKSVGIYNSIWALILPGGADLQYHTDAELFQGPSLCADGIRTD